MEFDPNLPFTKEIWLRNIYPKIRNLLSIAEESDSEVQSKVNELINITKFNMKFSLSNSKIICFGAAPHLEDYNSIIPSIVSNKIPMCSADGATRWLLEQNIIPKLIVTDLDGLTIDDVQFLIEEESSFLQILCHGDNLPRVSKVIEELQLQSSDYIEFVTQGTPLPNWNTSLGFTDGDRAISYLVQRGNLPLVLGFDLEADQIGRYSKPSFISHMPISERKRNKLKIAEQILQWISNSCRIYRDNKSKCPGEVIKFEDYILSNFN